jgi:hypothetical protein
VPAPVLLRFAAGLGALAAGLAGVTIAALRLEHTPGPVSAAPAPSQSAAPAAPATPKATAGFPSPPAGAVVYSREDGSNALALGVVAQTSQLLVQASVVSPQGDGVRGLRVTFTLDGVTSAAAACGAGCYRATLASAGRPTAVTVGVRGGTATTRWRVALPARWPAPDASALMARAGRTWRALRSLTYDEHLASGPTQEVTSTWRIAAPDRLAYFIQGGSEAVVIGNRRWDRQPGGRWIESPQLPLTQPLPFWASVTDAHVLGSGTLGGRPVWIVSFFDPKTPGWFEIELEKKTTRTLELKMTATAHFMHDVYRSFDRPAGIRPPA